MYGAEQINLVTYSKPLALYFYLSVVFFAFVVLFPTTINIISGATWSIISCPPPQKIVRCNSVTSNKANMKTHNRVSYQGSRWPKRGGIATGVRVDHCAPHWHSVPVCARMCLCVCVCVCVCDTGDKRS